MATFDVTVVRTSYASHTFRVEAKNKKEAKEIALDNAGSESFSEKDADYSVEYIIPVDEVKAAGRAMAGRK